MRAAGGDGEITLSGPPRNASAIVPLDAPGRVVVPIRIALAGQPAIYRAHVRPFGHGTSEIRLRLPDETPPGTYTGQGPLGGRQRGVVVEIEPVLRLRVQPKRTSLAVEAGSRTGFGVTIVNGGNVPFDVPRVSVFDFDDAEGQDRALGRALRATLAEGERRVDRFFEEIRAEHGGEARVAVREGAGRIGPGESRILTCLLEVPVTVQAERSYLGAWTLGNASHVIVIDVRKAPRPTPGGRADD